MAVDFTKAVRGGAALGTIAPAQPRPPAAGPGAAQGLLRRLLRAVLGPVVRRVEARMRRAVDLSQTAERVAQLQDSVVAIARGLHELRALRSQSLAAMPQAQRTEADLGTEIAIWSPDGYLRVPAEDAMLVAVMRASPVLEPGTRRVLMALLRPGMTCLEVGAHIGTLTLPAAFAVGPEGVVHAFEPVPRLAALLRHNLETNGVASRVRIIEAAAGETSGIAMLHVGAPYGHSSLLALDEGEIARVPVALRRVDEVLPAGTHVDVVKIDAEGAELAVWAGMRRVLAENHDLAVLVEFGPSHLARAGIGLDAWLDTLLSDGFDFYVVDEQDATCRKFDLQQLAAVYSVNLLLLRGAAASNPNLSFA
jgi:FkbM family methyltransferase